MKDLLQREQGKENTNGKDARGRKTGHLHNSHEIPDAVNKDLA